MMNLDPQYGTIYVSGEGEEAECYQLQNFTEYVLYRLTAREAEPYEIYCFLERSFKDLTFTPENLADYANKLVSLFESKLIPQESFESMRKFALKELQRKAPNFKSVETSERVALLDELNMLRSWVNNIKPGSNYDSSAACKEDELDDKIKRTFNEVFSSQAAGIDDLD